MFPVRIVVGPERKLIGLKQEMSFGNFTIAQLWQQFITRKQEIKNVSSKDLYSLAFYPTDFFESFDPSKTFTRMACAEVSDVRTIPVDMESIIIPQSLYAVFSYKGSSSDNRIFEYIYGQWINESEYELDDRPHFEILGEKYKNGSEDSEEEIWVPIR